MIWTERLNARLGRIDVGGAAIEVLYWAHSDALPDNVPHRHAYFEVCLVGQHGAGIYTLEGRKHDLAPGSVFFARPGFVHQIQNIALPLMELFWIAFTVAPPGSSFSSKDEGARLAQSFSASSRAVTLDDGSVGALWSTLRLVAAQRPNSGDALLIEQLQRTLLAALMRAGIETDTLATPSTSEDARENGLARLAVLYIHDNLDRRLPVSEIASHLHVSPRHLSRLLTSFTGAAPAAYIEHARMDRARALLQNSEVPVKAVAAKVGYGDVHHFTRAFTRHHKIAPANFRKNSATYSANIRKPGALV